MAMQTEYGLSLIEVLVVLFILASLASGYSKTEDHLRTLRAHRLCSNIEHYLNSLKFISEHKNSTAVLLVREDKELLGIDAGKIIFRELIQPNIVELKSGIGSPNSILFYPSNSSSPSTIEVKNGPETFCSISVSLRGRIRKFIYDN